MFVQEFALVDCPFDDVARRLIEHLDDVLGAATADTSADGDRLRRRVSPEGWPESLGKQVVLTLGPVRRQASSLLVAFSWESAGPLALFPRLDADIEVAPYGTSETSLTLRGRYDPPAGSLGRRLDELVLHRVAKGTVRAFLDSVRDRLDPTIGWGLAGDGDHRRH